MQINPIFLTSAPLSPLANSKEPAPEALHQVAQAQLTELQAALAGDFSAEQLQSIDNTAAAMSRQLTPLLEDPQALDMAVASTVRAKRSAAYSASPDMDVIKAINSPAFRARVTSRYQAYTSDLANLLGSVKDTLIRDPDGTLRFDHEGGREISDATNLTYIAYIADFISKFRGDAGVLANFSTKQAAEAFFAELEPDRAIITRETSGQYAGQYVVRVDIKADLRPLIDVMILPGYSSSYPDLILEKMVDEGARDVIMYHDPRFGFSVMWAGGAEIPFQWQHVNSEWEDRFNSAAESIKYTAADFVLIPSSTDFANAFERVIQHYMDNRVQPTGNTLAKYGAYMSDLADMMTKVNSRVTTENGKTAIDTPTALGDMHQFISKWRGDEGVFASFSTDEEAQAFLGQFQTHTLKVSHETSGTYADRYVVRIDLKEAIRPLLEVMVIDNEVGKPSVEIILNSMIADGDPRIPTIAKDNRGRPTDNYELWYPSHPGGSYDRQIYFHGKNLNTQWEQLLTLAIDDSKRTHSMESQLLTDRFGRVNGQYDQLLKLYTSFSTTLLELARAILEV